MRQFKRSALLVLCGLILGACAAPAAVMAINATHLDRVSGWTNLHDGNNDDYPEADTRISAVDVNGEVRCYVMERDWRKRSYGGISCLPLDQVLNQEPIRQGDTQQPAADPVPETHADPVRSDPKPEKEQSASGWLADMGWQPPIPEPR
jgi:hypothetical protein